MNLEIGPEATAVCASEHSLASPDEQHEAGILYDCSGKLIARFRFSVCGLLYLLPAQSAGPDAPQHSNYNK